MQDLRYPIGQFEHDNVIRDDEIKNWIHEIETLPAKLRSTIEGLSDEQLDTPYRPEGWTIRQVVHHLADSHMNSFVRFKLALTEDTPTIKPYFEDRWGELADCSMPIDSSLALLDGLHARWTALLRSLSPEELAKSFNHPEMTDKIVLAWNIGLYAWHGQHHLGHITNLMAREAWRSPGHSY
jgi:hypothetical protein